jgi:hypothetical protein
MLNRCWLYWFCCYPLPRPSSRRLPKSFNVPWIWTSETGNELVIILLSNTWNSGYLIATAA